MEPWLKNTDLSYICTAHFSFQMQLLNQMQNKQQSKQQHNHTWLVSNKIDGCKVTTRRFNSDMKSADLLGFIMDLIIKLVFLGVQQ